MLQIRVLQLASDFKAELRPLSHAEGILNINWDLRELWKGGWGWGGWVERRVDSTSWKLIPLDIVYIFISSN